MRSTSVVCLLALACATVVVACSSDPEPAGADDGGPTVSLGDAGFFDARTSDGDKTVVDGGYAGPDGAVVRADRFVTKVVSATYGDCAGFGLPSMPAVVLGPPVGAGALSGGLDVVSLGFRGELVLSFEPNEIVDGPGADFIVFENAFWAGGNPNKPTAELADVSVSDDGVTWKTFTCTPGAAPPYTGCAGWRPIYAAPGNGISPVDPATAGGDPFDLAELGVNSARFVRIRDLGTVPCPTNPANKSTSVGFDLDAVSVVNAKTP